MTYLIFLFLFLVPPIVALLLIQDAPAKSTYSLLAVCILALVYTTPWDNFLVYSNVWTYGADRVLFTIGYVPFEEYLFFVLQPLFTGLAALWLLRRDENKRSPIPSPLKRVGTLFLSAVSLFGLFLLMKGDDKKLYAGLILTWSAPPLAGMWYFGADLIWRRLRAYGLGVMLPTLYLWIIDRLAIRWEIWHISKQYSLNWTPWGLPIEEALFFLVTNLLCVTGLFLFRYGDELGQSPHHVHSR